MPPRMIAAALAGCCLVLLAIAQAQAAETRPNIVFIMADDLGNADLGLSRRRGQDTQHRRAGTGGRAARILLRPAALHPGAGRPDDRALPHALRSAVVRDLPEPHLRARHRRADPAAGPQGSRLRHLDGRQMASRPCRPQILATESRLRPFLRQRDGRGRLLHQGARRRCRLAAQRDLPEGGGLLHRPDRRRGGAPDRAGRPAAAVLPLRRIPGAARALPGDRRADRLSIPRSRTRIAGPTWA